MVAGNSAASTMSGTLVGRRGLTTGLAMGSTIALGRCDLAPIGGSAAVTTFLDDDHEVVVRIQGGRRGVQRSDCVAVRVLGVPPFREQWQQGHRWAYCNGESRPCRSTSG